jgi:hypothetical protein
MNTTFKTQTLALREIVPFFLLVCLLAFALFSPVVVCLAQAPAPIATPDGQTQINAAGPQLAQAEPSPAKIPTDEVASLVGPIALYPDPLLTQVLAASTYPLEIVQLKQWLNKNKNLKDKALADAVAQQNWDPSVQALAAFPAVVDKLANNIQWTTDLGNAFLAQESDVMDSVQDLREKAQANGALKTNDKQKVGTEATQDGKQAITIESAQRDVVYVPTYKTEVVYRDSGYSSSSGYSNSSDSSRYSGSSDYSGYSGSSDSDYSYLGYAVGAASGYYWGRYNWRDGYADVNGNNYYVKNYNSKWNNNSNNSYRNEANKYSQRLSEGSGKWQHDPSHRGSTPYGNSNLANRFGQANNRLTGSNLANRSSQFAKTSAPAQAARGNLSRAPGDASSGIRAPNAGAANRIGNRMPANSFGGARGGAFSAPKGDFARSSSARGAQSLRPPGGFRGGPPGGRGGPPNGFGGGPPSGFRGGPPIGGGGPPMGGGGPPIGGGMPMGAPPPPPPPGP